MEQSKKDSKRSGQKKKKQPPAATTLHPETEPNIPRVRFGAIIQPGSNAKNKNWIDRLDIDRVPGATNEVRALVTPEDCVRLLEQGFEIHLQKAYPVQPLNPALVMSDESHKAALDLQLKRIKPAKG